MSEPASSPDQVRTVADLDPWLKPYRHRLVERQRYLDYHEERILGDRSVSTFALGHLYYGLHRTKRGWVLREWAPNAGQIYLICQATNWRDDPAYRLERLPGSNGDWEIKLPLYTLHHLDHYRLHIHWCKTRRPSSLTQWSGSPRNRSFGGTEPNYRCRTKP